MECAKELIDLAQRISALSDADKNELLTYLLALRDTVENGAPPASSQD